MDDNLFPSFSPSDPGPSSLSHYHYHQSPPDGAGTVSGGTGGGGSSPDDEVEGEGEASGSGRGGGSGAGAGGASQKAQKGTDGNKKSKKGKEVQENGKERVKRVRVAACDTCRMRKVKCIRPDGSPSVADQHPQQRCQGCLDLNRECTYSYVAKKPGPPNPYAGVPPIASRPSFNSSTSDRYAPYPPTTAPLPPSQSQRHRSLSNYAAESRPGLSSSSNNNNVGLKPNLSPTTNARHRPQVDYWSDLHTQAARGDERSLFVGGGNGGGTGNGRGNNGHGSILTDRHSLLARGGGGGAGGPGGASGGGGGSTSAEGSYTPATRLGSLGMSPGGLFQDVPSGSTGKGNSGTGFLNNLNSEDSLFLPWIVGSSSAEYANTGLDLPEPPNSSSRNDHPNFLDGSNSSSMAGLVDASALAWDHLKSGEEIMKSNYWSRESALRMDATHLSQNRPSSNSNMRSSTSSGPEQQKIPIPVASGSGWQQGAAKTWSTAGDVSEESNPHLPVLEDATSWSTIMCLLSLYHEHLYPLLPLTHWPSFSQQLIARKDRKDTVFRAFVFSLVAYSILQLPRSVIPDNLSQLELLNLHRRCHEFSQRLQPRTYDPPELLHISTLYCDHIYEGSIGRENRANVILAEAMRLAIAMGLHDESIGNVGNFNEIEQQTRRRVFWVLYGSDRSIAVLISCPMLLCDEDIFVDEILAVDDDLITAAGAFPQPVGRTPILAGFLHVTRLFRLLSRVIQLFRRRSRPTPFSNDELVDPRNLIQALQSLLDDLPPALRIDGVAEESQSKMDMVAFDICKANILVSQVLVRFAIYQYAIAREHGRPEECLQDLTQDVLRRLNAMSSESLAANGASIRVKVLFIASSLLNKYPAGNAGHDYVLDFLTVYNKILTNQTPMEDTSPGDPGTGGDAASGGSLGR